MDDDIEPGQVFDCHRCNDSGEVAISSHTLNYRGPGPVPDHAKGVIGVPCDRCGWNR